MNSFRLDVSAENSSVEPLERRTHFSVSLRGNDVVVLGTDGPDSITGEILRLLNDVRAYVIVNGVRSAIPELPNRISVWAGRGDDTIAFNFHNSQLPRLDVHGGKGHDRVDLTGYGIVGVASVGGDAGDDTIQSSLGPQTLQGGPGDDRLVSHSGDDLLRGGPGDDTLEGGSGNDTLYGEAGDDLLRGGGGNAFPGVYDGGDFIYGCGGNDRLEGGTGGDRLFGNQGNDTLLGGSGKDFVTGGAGRDHSR